MIVNFVLLVLHVREEKGELEEKEDMEEEERKACQGRE